MENFKEIDGYDRYFVNTKGDVYSTKTNKMLKPLNDKCGYKMVSLYRDGKLKKAKIHRLVAEAYIPNTLELPSVNHINTIRDDNRVENLEWCNQMYNCQSVNTNKQIGNISITFRINLNGKVLRYTCPTVEIAEKMRLIYTPIDW